MEEEHASDMLVGFSLECELVFARVRTRELNQGTCGQRCEPAARLPDSRA